MATNPARAIRGLFRRGHRRDPRIAWLSPMPPAPTGIATYSRAVLEGLERIGYGDRRRIDVIWPIRPQHEATVAWHALGVYHLGNNVEFHRDIYRHAMQSPGLVVIHDLALDDFVRGMKTGGDPLGFEAEREALASADRRTLPDALADEPLRVPFVARVARRARGIIAHSPFVERYLRDLGCRTPVFVAPHPVVERPEDVRAAEARRAVLRGGLEAQGMRALVGVFGDLNEAKLIDVVLEAVRRLPEEVHAILVGRRISGYDVDAVVRASGLGGRATVLPDVTDADFLAWLCAADVAVDLRHPHRGESSGALSRAMQCGLAAVVSATGTYLDLPDDAVVRVSPGRVDAGELSSALRDLLDDPERRASIGARARERLETLAASDATAHAYAAAMDGTLALVHDPARRALARWAGALVDIGVTEDMLREGYGRAYADAIEELRAPRSEAEGEGSRR